MVMDREQEAPLGVDLELSRLTGRKAVGGTVGPSESHQVESGMGGWQPTVWKRGAESQTHIPVVVLGAARGPEGCCQLPR